MMTFMVRFSDVFSGYLFCCTARSFSFFEAGDQLAVVVEVVAVLVVS